MVKFTIYITSKDKKTSVSAVKEKIVDTTDIAPGDYQSLVLRLRGG